MPRRATRATISLSPDMPIPRAQMFYGAPLFIHSCFDYVRERKKTAHLCVAMRARHAALFEKDEKHMFDTSSSPCRALFCALSSE